MTPNGILNSTGLRVGSGLPGARVSGLGGGAGGAGEMFALPGAPGACGPGDGTGAAEKADPGAHESKKSEKADEAKDGDESDDAGAEEAQGEGARGPKDAAEQAQQAAQLAASAAIQPLTIHTLNGMLLTLPATPVAAVAARSGGRTPVGGMGVGGQPNAGGTVDSATQGAGGGDRGVAGAEQSGRGSGGQGQGEGSAQARQDALRRSTMDMAAGLEPAPGRQRRATNEGGTLERTGPVSGARVGAAAPQVPRDVSPLNPAGARPVIGRGGTVGEVGALRKADAAGRPGVPNERTGPAQVVRGVLAAVNQRGGKVTLDLQPGELGRMRVELKLDARTATATFHVEGPQARRLLEEAMPLLRQALTDRGVTLERADVVAPSVELPGALAAMQAGTTMVAFVAPEQLDLGGDAKRQDDDTPSRNEPTDGLEREGAGVEGETDEGSGSPGDRMILGSRTDGVDVIA